MHNSKGGIYFITTLLESITKYTQHFTMLSVNKHTVFSISGKHDSKKHLRIKN